MKQVRAFIVIYEGHGLTSGQSSDIANVIASKKGNPLSLTEFTQKEIESFVAGHIPTVCVTACNNTPLMEAIRVIHEEVSKLPVVNIVTVTLALEKRSEEDPSIVRAIKLVKEASIEDLQEAYNKLGLDFQESVHIFCKYYA